MRRWAKPAVIVNRLAWAADGRGPLPRGFTQVFPIDSTLGGTPRQITTGKYNHNGPGMVRRRENDLRVRDSQAGS